VGLSRIEDLLANLSVEDKVRLIVGVGVPREVPGAGGETRSVGAIRAISLTDGPSGVRIEGTAEKWYYATAFPAPIMLASTWNPDIVEAVGRAMGEEAKYYNISVLLAPGLNIHRHPLCGRNFEYYSEDPLLAGVMAASFIRGVQSTGVAATPKHFVANDQETNRTTIDTIVSERALREIYLKAFEIAIKTGRPWALMTSYNKLNGKYTSQNEWLLTKVLREEWGFDGLVMTDWGAGDNPVEQIKAGVDLIMPGSDEFIPWLLEAYKHGVLHISHIDRAARRVLELIERTRPAREGEKRLDLEAHAKLAYEAAAEGVVLLKNNGALPLKPGTKVAVFGTGQVETLKSGMGSGHNHPPYTITILDGLKASDLVVDEELSSKYYNYVLQVRGSEFLNKLYKCEIKPEPIRQDIVSEEEVAKYAERNDVALVVITRISGEGWDRKVEKGDFYLDDSEARLIEVVSSKFHERGKKVIVVLNIAGPIEVASWRDKVDAILLIWLPGQEAGRVLADALLGRVNPSGKLPITFPKDWKDTPVGRDPRCYPGLPAENPRYVVYCEDIYVGYRYYDTFDVEPAYEFGYGLSYTKFEYRNLVVEKRDVEVVVKFDVVNVGAYPGKEVAQVYIRAPRVKLEKPFQELKGFKKTRLLQPGEVEHVEIKIPIRELASYDPARRAWVVEPGLYQVRVGSSSRDVRLVGSFTVDQELVFHVVAVS
jgi:beta-glucosidase